MLKLFATVTTYWNGIAGGIFYAISHYWRGYRHHVMGNQQRHGRSTLFGHFMYGSLLAGGTIPCNSQRSGDGNDWAQPVLIWLLISSIIASIISRQFSPKPFLPLCGWTFPPTNAGTTSKEDLRRNKIQEK